jgi:hypothetical protein
MPRNNAAMTALTAADFDNPEVDGASNPSQFGYHHGPIYLRPEAVTIEVTQSDACKTEITGDPNSEQPSTIQTRAQSLSDV